MKNIYLFLCILFSLCAAKEATAQVPKLNSFPSASAVIFLDFDGHIVEGTSWNYDGPLVCESANLNVTQITEIFNRVAEDYRPFNLNVTTDSTRYAAAPVTQRMRVLLTTSSSWYGPAGGVAFTNSFTWGDNTPCFVFTALLNNNLKTISEAASHEAGHTLGLNHQSAYDAVCNKTAEYHSGSGSGEIGWAPIMGVGYYRNLTLWHYGSNPFGCSYMQDDLGIITSSYNGFGFRPDDHGNLEAVATKAIVSNNQFSVGGVIEQPNDRDLIQFTLTSKSQVQLNALPYSVSSGYSGANVDLQVELINLATATVSMYNPANILRVSVDTVLPAGIYYLRVMSKGNQFAPNYAALGSYTINGTIVSATLPVHKLELKATASQSRHQLDWEIVADENVVEQTLEVATDGAAFGHLSNTAANARKYTHQPTAAGVLYYRLRVLFDNGRTYYSNVAALRSNGASSKPSLVGNLVAGSLAINSPSGFDYTIYDRTGRQMARGRLVQGRNDVSTGYLTPGIYIIQYTANHEHYTERFMKQ